MSAETDITVLKERPLKLLVLLVLTEYEQLLIVPLLEEQSQTVLNVQTATIVLESLILFSQQILPNDVSQEIIVFLGAVNQLFVRQADIVSRLIQLQFSQTMLLLRDHVLPLITVLKEQSLKLYAQIRHFVRLGLDLKEESQSLAPQESTCQVLFVNSATKDSSAMLMQTQQHQMMVLTVMNVLKETTAIQKFQCYQSNALKEPTETKLKENLSKIVFNALETLIQSRKDLLYAFHAEQVQYLSQGQRNAQLLGNIESGWSQLVIQNV